MIAPKKLKIGSPVAGDDFFFPRPDVLRHLRKTLLRDHVSFLAPRRTGKTSILKRLESQAPSNHPHYFINLETSTSPAHMLGQLFSPFLKENSPWQKITDGLTRKIKDLLKTIDSLQVVGNGVKFKPGTNDWQTPAAKFLRLLVTHEGRITFLLDEFPILVNNIAKRDRDECEAMLRWFHKWRQETSDSQIRFLVTGSIGLAGVVRRHRFGDTVNDFDSIPLPPLNDAEASDFIQALALGCQPQLAIDAPAAARLLSLLGNAYPYFIQIFIDEIDNSVPTSGDRLVTTDLIDQVYREKMVMAPRNEYLKHMWDRLDDTFTSRESKLARALLKAVARPESGLSLEEITEAARQSLPQSDSPEEGELNHILEVLKHDGYLQQESAPPFRTRYFTNLLRDNCLRRYA